LPSYSVALDLLKSLLVTAFVSFAFNQVMSVLFLADVAQVPAHFSCIGVCVLFCWGANLQMMPDLL